MPKSNKKRMLMYWIASKHRLFHLIEDNLKMNVGSGYGRLYHGKGRIDYTSTAIADEINRLRQTNIDIVTLCQLYTREDADGIIAKL